MSKDMIPEDEFDDAMAIGRKIMNFCRAHGIDASALIESAYPEVQQAFATHMLSVIKDKDPELFVEVCGDAIADPDSVAEFTAEAIRKRDH